LFDAFGKLGSASPLESIDLRMNHIPADSVKRLVRHMCQSKAMPNLKTLDLRQNLIGDEVLQRKRRRMLTFCGTSSLWEGG